MAQDVDAVPRSSDLARHLHALLLRSGRLLDGAAGSISMVDATGTSYAKSAEHGASCRLGAVFPLDEGVTGQVVARRRPVVLVRYSDLRVGHLHDHPARHGAVAAVPLWWQGDVVGANVVFAGRARRFTTAEVDELELLTQVAVPGILRAGSGQPALAHLPRGRHDVLTGPTGAVRPVAASSLTPRELQTLRLLVRGLTNQQIATALAGLAQDGGEARRGGAGQDRRRQPHRRGGGRPATGLGGRVHRAGPPRPWGGSPMAG